LRYNHIKIATFSLIVLFIGFISYTIVVCSAGSIETKNPHQKNNQSFQGKCKDCHSSDPLVSSQAEETIHSEKFRAQCISCHTIPESCRLITTKEATQILKSQLNYLGITLFSEVISCRSCHVFHQPAGRPINEKRLNKYYSNFWSRVQKINPHKAGVFCQLCHETAIGLSGENLQLKFRGDRIGVCIQCHDGKKARADNHPIGITPSKEKGMIMPDGFPLHNGKLTCLTCHYMPCKGLGRVETNFLRGGPYKKRVDACLLCHSEDKYRAVNPHIQIDPNGKLMKNKCLYCHVID